jgi:hypothetical protein
MDCKEGISTNKAPFLYGTNYASWSIKMKKYLMAFGFGIRESITTGYIGEVRKESSEHNAKEIVFILSGLSNSKNVKVMQCTSAK